MHKQVILQIGDLHYPEFEKKQTAVDVHDRHTPGQLDRELGLPVPAAIKRAIVAEISANPELVVAICGDITTKGDRGGFLKGLEFLAGAILSGPVGMSRAMDRIHMVPGNHDVAYKDDQPFSSFDDVARFDVLADATSAAGFVDIFAVTSRRTRVTNTTGGGLSIISANTCRGTGARRSDLAGDGRDVAAEREASLVASSNGAGGDGSPSAEGSNAKYDEVLDVPLLHPEELRAIADAWNNLDNTVLPVLLTHHGLLPQHTPRLNPYTEMANGGQARKALANLHRPVLYLHGHIHEHVVEVVDFPKNSDTLPMHDRIVMIAAPELKDGFNEISIFFSSNGYPIGIEIEQFRIKHGDQSVTRDPHRVSIALRDQGPLDVARRKILAYLADNGMASGAELISHGATVLPVIDPDEVQATVEALIWTGVVRRGSHTRSDFGSEGYHL